MRVNFIEGPRQAGFFFTALKLLLQRRTTTQSQRHPAIDTARPKSSVRCRSPWSKTHSHRLTASSELRRRSSTPALVVRGKQRAERTPDRTVMSSSRAGHALDQTGLFSSGAACRVVACPCRARSMESGRLLARGHAEARLACKATEASAGRGAGPVAARIASGVLYLLAVTPAVAAASTTPGRHIRARESGHDGCGHGR